jgi:hypothetical protein
MNSEVSRETGLNNSLPVLPSNLNTECKKCGSEINLVTGRCSDCHYSELEGYASHQDARDYTHSG